MNAGHKGRQIFEVIKMDKQVFTLRQIADMLGQTQQRINYIIARDRIPSRAKVANVRLFDEDARDRIRKALSSMNTRKSNAR